MAKSLKYLFYILLLAFITFAIFKFKFWFNPPKANIVSKTEVIMERMERVSKLIAVEGYFTELYDKKSYYYYDIWPLSKKAIIRVKAKVSVGYDFKQIAMEADEQNRIIRILNFPPPEILSIDHDLDYYDISEGVFNTFSSKDYTELNKGAKDFIREVALKSELFEEAEKQKSELINMFEWMATAAGWTIQVGDNESITEKEHLF